jgi:anti-sigma B factor antagonist
MTGVRIEIDRVEDAVVAQPSIDFLDVSNCGEFRQALRPALKQAARVVLDLSEVGFVDSSGLGAILSCLRKVTDGGGRMVLCGMTQQVQSLFDLVRMHRVIDVFPTRGDALTALHAPSA